MSGSAVPLYQREHDYIAAENRAADVAARWLEARTIDIPDVLNAAEDELDEAMRDLLRAKRRYEKAYRKTYKTR